MWHYQAPLRDMRFVVEELLDLPARWRELPAHAELDADTARQVVEEAGRFAAEVLAPLNATGDVEGCTWRPDGSVTTPKGFREAYRAYVEAGWPALVADPEFGGQGLPHGLSACLNEMLNSANHAWNMYPGVLHGAAECLQRHASPELQERYLAKVVSGEWLATMCLTEAHAGSDVGLLKTRADAQPDGSYRLRGTKIFASGGEHDLTDNIVHLVLARLADAPAGTRGVSLFVVPRELPDGTRNAVLCGGIEKKMGIKGSATCVLNFDGATGWLVGEPNKGLQAMFSMMNAVRLHTALQGLGHAESAFQNSLAYALERVQSRTTPRAEGRAAEAADPIALHPAIRHNLLRQRALLEGGRVLAYEAAHLLDLHHHHPDAATSSAANDDLSLLTPILKAYLTDIGFAGACAAQQVYGGHGYVHDYGVEQCVRDSRIAMIYEGTNEIQAIDLLVRKVLADGGARFGALLKRLEGSLPDTEFASKAKVWLASWQQITQHIAQQAKADAELPFRVAGDYLRLAGGVLLAHCWARAEAVAARGDSPFHATKRETANYYMDFVLPEAGLYLARLRAGNSPLPQLAPVEP